MTVIGHPFFWVKKCWSINWFLGVIRDWFWNNILLYLFVDVMHAFFKCSNDLISHWIFWVNVASVNHAVLPLPDHSLIQLCTFLGDFITKKEYWCVSLSFGLKLLACNILWKKRLNAVYTQFHSLCQLISCCSIQAI